eukprot:163081-Prorocentrum_minimum.AAC.1
MLGFPGAHLLRLFVQDGGPLAQLFPHSLVLLHLGLVLGAAALLLVERGQPLLAVVYPAGR